jgi:putative pyruvate formate lyase activating enzyme
MEMQSRRRFIQACLSAGAAGLSCPLMCKAGRRAVIPAPVQKLSKFEAESLSGAGGKARIDPGFEAGYLKLHRMGELRKRGEALWSIMEQCKLCPRSDETKRLDGEEGKCGASDILEISSFQPHFGEERPLVGRGGSGAIFFTNCSLKCVFCINWQVSQEGQGESCTVTDLALMMLQLQAMGCHNINVVTPTHYSAHILLALDRAAHFGLRLPLVYNTCGWERLEILQLLDGVVDVYMPDFKYWDGKMAAKYSAEEALNYPDITKKALLEMQRQVGTAHPARDGLMYRGLMIRHLVMPNNVGGSKEVIKWIAEHLPKDTYVNIMSQYTPCYKAVDYPEIARRITNAEYAEVVKTAREAGLTNLDIQGYRRLILGPADLL